MKHELLLPAGNLEMVLAAIHNGADAVYLGVPKFNARGRSVDLEISELKNIIETCHLYGVKVNLAFNIVIFEDEIENAHEILAQIIPLKPDAFIVQDIGMVRLIKKMAPQQVVHASTQMTITNHEAIHLVEDLNIKRFVLGRENSLSEIKLIKQNTSKELEVFVHGALCVSYSGQCFTSESIGGRSANRGQCAQSCRFSYDLMVDGQKHNTLDRDYLVSPQDLCGIEHIDELIAIGVESFKIEGRLKTPDYVASAASSYRAAIDRSLAQKPLQFDELKEKQRQMATAYSRGFYPGWLQGVQHQKLVDGTFSAHRGHSIGKITSIGPSSLIIEITESVELKAGDGILWVFESNNKMVEKGSFLFAVESLGANRLQVDVDKSQVLGKEIIGAKVYLNHDKDLKKLWQKSWNDKNFAKRIPVEINITLKLGEPLRAVLSDGKRLVRSESCSALQLAKKQGVSDLLITEEFSALGGTVFVSDKIDIRRDSPEDLFISHKEIKELRRSLTNQLETLRREQTVDMFEAVVIENQQVQEWLGTEGHFSQSSPHPVALNIVLRNKDQVEDLVKAIAEAKLSKDRFGFVFLDFEFGRDILGSLDMLKKYSIKAGVATTRILKPSEYGNLKAIAKMSPDAILIRNLGALEYYRKNPVSNCSLIGDFSLNVTNHLTAQYLLDKGLSSLCVSYDLNHRQVSSLLQNSDASRLEVTVHQYMPSFHMEHCVFAAFLSKGASWRDCGKPCEKHKVELQDQFGHRHHIKPDQECRNTMYNAIPQSAARFVADWESFGLGNIRFEALNEQGDELILKISAYLDLMEHKISVEQLRVKLHSVESYGLSEGALSRELEYQSRKKNENKISQNSSGQL